jgi:hypothetical protein
VAITALLLGGCGASDSARQQVPSSTCMAPTCPVAVGPWAMQVTPPSDVQTIYADADLPEVMFDQNGEFQVMLQPLVHIHGVVYIGSASGQKLMNGTVLATRPSRIAGQPDRSYQALIDSSGRYALAVSTSLPGETYTLRIVADPKQFAPQTFQVVADGDTMFDPVLDDPASVINVFGSIKDQMGKGVPGMQVQAVDVVTQTPVSTIDQTDGTGAYSIYLSSTVLRLSGKIQVVASPMAGVTQPILSSQEFPISAQTMAVPASMVAPAMLLPQSFRYPVIGVSSGGAEVPVVNASCRFTATVVSNGGSVANATVVVEAQTDSEGAVTVELVPMLTYQVQISPPPNSDFMSTMKSINVGAAGGVGETQTLALRPKLQARLLDLMGQPVASVTVEPGPSKVSDASDATSLAQVNKLGTASTDASGRFVLRIDPDTYDVALVPSAGQLLPRRWLPRTQVTGDTDLGDVLLSRGTVARAVVVDPGGNPVLGASVQIYGIDRNNMNCTGPKADSCLAPPRLEAAGTTDGTGALPMLLPAAN